MGIVLNQIDESVFDYKVDYGIGEFNSGLAQKGSGQQNVPNGAQTNYENFGR
jgi:hypothetical protein